MLLKCWFLFPVFSTTMCGMGFSPFINLNNAIWENTYPHMIFF